MPTGGAPYEYSRGTYGAALDYHVSGFTLRFHTHDVDTKASVHPDTITGSWADWGPKNPTIAVREWNTSRVICRLNTIEYWLNGIKAFDIRVDNEIRAVNAENPGEEFRDLSRAFATRWRRSRTQSLYLSILAPPPDDPDGPPGIQIRSIRVHSLVDVK